MEKKAAGEYDACYADIFKHYQPVGWLEEHRVETIAVWSWRLRRMIRHESGQIARALAEHNYSLQQSRAADTEEPDAVPSSSPQMDAMTDHLFLTSEGLEEQMRYEAMINRQLNHAIAELERLQTRRKGRNDRGIDFTKQSQEAL
jgi:DNA recombination-dependent growth factor C